MTSTEGRELVLPLDFLGGGQFEAELYVDQPADGPTAVVIRKQAVSAAAPLRIVMPRAGGFAGRLTPSAR